jgi:hypothetical protein
MDVSPRPPRQPIRPRAVQLPLPALREPGAADPVRSRSLMPCQALKEPAEQRYQRIKHHVVCFVPCFQDETPAADAARAR